MAEYVDFAPGQLKRVKCLANTLQAVPAVRRASGSLRRCLVHLCSSRRVKDP